MLEVRPGAAFEQISRIDCERPKKNRHIPMQGMPKRSQVRKEILNGLQAMPEAPQTGPELVLQ
jgi:hypothetical protein